LKKNDLYIILIAAAFFYFLNKGKKTDQKQIIIKEVPKVAGITETTF